MRNVWIKLTLEEHEKLKEMAESEYRTLTAFIRKAILDKWENYERDANKKNKKDGE